MNYQSKGRSVHLLKAGSKRRRTKDELESSQKLEESKDDKTEHLKFQYQLLQEELAKTKVEAESNKAASQILSQMIESGEAVQEKDGTVSVRKHGNKKGGGPVNAEMK